MEVQQFKVVTSVASVDKDDLELLAQTKTKTKKTRQKLKLKMIIATTNLTEETYE